MAALMIGELEMDTWNERAAIMQFDGGMSRFQAETKAAQGLGRERWEFVDAERKRDSEIGGDRGATMAGQQRPDHLPGVQPAPEKENGPVPERDAQTGRGGVALPSLRPQRRGVL
jgi:hypothetical protein